MSERAIAAIASAQQLAVARRRHIGALLGLGAAIGLPLQPAAADTAPGIADIVVTAQRRAQSLQEVPVAVTVRSGAALLDAQVLNIADIQTVSPGTSFQVANFPAASANILIRGLGTVGQARSFEGSVGVFIDGVYRTRPAAALQDFLDIDSLQILRGPQGTLFGKNTTAGALLLTSAAPALDRAAGMVDLGLGNYGAVQARATVNLPLNESLALRLAGLVSTSDNFYRNPTTGGHHDGDAATAIKGQLLWRPGGWLTVRLIGDYAQTDSICCYLSNDLVDGAGEDVIARLTLANGGVLPPSGRLAFARTLNSDGRGRVRDYGATLLLDADLGGSKLQSVTAWRQFSADHRDMDGDLGGADLELYAESFASRFLSQELNWSTTVQPLGAELLLGAYVSDERLRMTQGLFWGTQAQDYWDATLAPGLVYAPPGLWSDARMEGRARSWALYGHAELPLTRKLRLVAGLRFSTDHKRGAFHNAWYQPSPFDVLRVFGAMPGPAYDRARTERALSGTLGLEYRASDAAMLYATYNRGFKAGGINIDGNAAGGVANNPTEVPGAVPLDPGYRPERVNAYEAGAKLRYLGGRAQSNVALFYYDLSDVQIAQFLGLQFAVLNARAATDYGAEIENEFVLWPGVRLRLDGSWIPHANYGDDPRLGPELRNSRFRFVAKLQGNAELNVERPLSPQTILRGRLQYQYSGRQLVNTASTTARGAVGLWNADLGLRLAAAGLLVQAWARNLTDVRYYTQAFNTPVQAGDENVYLGAPRTFGLRLRADF